MFDRNQFGLREMAIILTLVLATGSSLPTSMTHAATYLYVSMAPEQKIQVYRLDSGTGALTAVDALPVEGAPGSLGVDPTKKFLFASLRTTSSLGSFRIDPATGKLSHISTAALPAGE